jgi:2-C-methyl-D-erythritol 2,4-cyclodiphosphate synthase
MRVGFGYDAHRLVPGRPLILGGVEIPHHSGLSGHSDADVLTHALGDALLGAVAAGDLGRHFPDSDPAYRGISSLILLERIVTVVQSRGFRPLNVDVTPNPGRSKHQGHQHRKDGLCRPGRGHRRVCRSPGGQGNGAFAVVPGFRVK